MTMVLDRPRGRAPMPDGTRRVDRRGHARIRVNGHWEYERRVVMEQLLGRPLVKGERVVQVNGQRGDVSPANLELWATVRVFPPMPTALTIAPGGNDSAHGTQNDPVAILVHDAAAHRQTVAKRRARQKRWNQRRKATR